ncbi:group II intron maturase-specific domain-containing protein [Natroniella acetigena]|uniref:group II intron maturase-specific domain-containing protein n=1 Tax=Natroniella acetigena TaxID=52004 RepID=UPI0031F6C7B8
MGGNYFKIGNVKRLYRKLDGWIRMRIRSFIEKKKAIIHQNHRLSNSYLRNKGLQSLLIDVL